MFSFFFFFFFFNDTATTEIYTLSLHDALPISVGCRPGTALRSRVSPPPGVGCGTHPRIVRRFHESRCASAGRAGARGCPPHPRRHDSTTAPLQRRQPSRLADGGRDER